MSDTQKLALKKIKKSINLPKTSFPMKANLSQNEPTSLKKWKKNNLYTRIVEKNKDKPSFIFMMALLMQTEISMLTFT